jgi:hypothetical protein
MLFLFFAAASTHRCQDLAATLPTASSSFFLCRFHSAERLFLFEDDGLQDPIGTSALFMQDCEYSLKLIKEGVVSECRTREGVLFREVFGQQGGVLQSMGLEGHPPEQPSD